MSANSDSDKFIIKSFAVILSRTSIRISNGASKRKEKPRAPLSICIEEIPKSKTTSSNSSGFNFEISEKGAFIKRKLSPYF